jgi:hypothetical protein
MHASSLKAGNEKNEKQLENSSRRKLVLVRISGLMCTEERRELKTYIWTEEALPCGYASCV